MRAKVVVSLLALIAAMVSGTTQAQSGPLDPFQWERRVLLLFADQSADPWAYAQRLALLKDRCDFNNRDLLLLEIYADQPVTATGVWFGGGGVEEAPLETASNADLRQAFNVESGFALILVGKDGWEKRRSLLPDNVNAIYAQIDGMPMRQREMRDDQCASKEQGS